MRHALLSLIFSVVVATTACETEESRGGEGQECLPYTVEYHY